MGQVCNQRKKLLPECSLIQARHIADFGRTRPEPATKVMRSLGRASMSERVRHHLPSRPLLNPVISHGAGRIQAFLDVTGFKNLTRFIGPIRPNAGEAVSL